MPTLCIQCMLEALVKKTTTPYKGFFAEPPMWIEETPEQHMKRQHPHGVSRDDRQQLEHEAMKIIMSRDFVPMKEEEP